MKKNKLLKAILVVVAILILGSWIIPASVFSNGVFSTSGHSPFGLLDIIQAPLHFFDWENLKRQLVTDGTTILAYSYISILLLIFVTSIFYSVLKKTGAYGKLVRDITKKFEKRRKVFFIGTSIFFLVFSSIVGIDMLAFILIPFFATILRKLDYSKISTFSATFLAVLFGKIVSISGSEITGINNIMYDVKVGNNILLKGLLLLLFTLVFIFYTQFKKEPEVEEEKEEEKIEVKEKSYAPIVMISIIFFVLLILGSYNWYYVFKTSSVYDAYESLMGVTVANGYPIAKNLFGMLEPFGYWSGFTISTILVLMIFMISFIYSISLEEIVECSKEGIKKMGKVAVYLVLSFIPMIMLTKIGGGTTFLTTIVGFIYNHITKFAVPFTTLATTVYGIFLGDYYPVASVLYGINTTFFEGGILSLSILTMQMVYGIISLVAPTSLFLVIGLSYFEIPYQKWLSYIWKLALIVLAFTFGFLLIMNLI